MSAPLPLGWYPDSTSVPERLRVPQPKDDPFYTYSGSTPLPDVAPGTVLATRAFRTTCWASRPR